VTSPEAGAPAGDEDLSSAERELLAAAHAGRFLVLRPGSIDLNNELHDPVAGPLWTNDQSIRAEVLAELLTGKRQLGTRPPRYVMLRGARITGSLDLMGAALVCPLWLWDCHIDRPVNLNEAQLNFNNAGLVNPGGTALMAERLSVDDTMSCTDGFTAQGEVRLSGARIDGNLDLRGARLSDPGGIALLADSLTVAQCVFCEDGKSGLSHARPESASRC
jgi:hypothetical protein